ncbi:MAG TPA: hypothetical protein DEQ14_08865 [Treponema sp.]|nr:hypothetical protein [Treponema sp.]
MTLSKRNIFFKAGIACCALSVLYIAAVSFIAIPVYSSLSVESLPRPAGFFQMIAGRWLNPNFYSVHISIAILSLYSLITLCLILRFFEQTQSPEILFIAFFVISLTCEPARLILPLQREYGIPSVYILLAARIVLFSRYFGLFSLFAASLYAAGMEPQKQRMFIFIVAISSLSIALGTPIDSFSWSANFNTIYGYSMIFRLLNGVILLMTVISFLIAAHLRASREYIFIGIGIFLVVAGRSMLLNTDTWTALPGILPLSFGAWFICNYLHKVYLWL